MKLFELFDDGPLDVMGDIKDSLLDILTPMVASKVPFVTVHHIVDKLRQMKTGIAINRNLVMTILDPNKIKMVDRIEGDRVYLRNDDAPENSLTQDDKEKDQDHVQDLAQKQAQKSMTPKGGDAPL